MWKKCDSKSHDVTLDGYLIYQTAFTKCVILDQVKRQNDDSYRDLLMRIRDGMADINDYKTLISRSPINLDLPSDFDEFPHLFPENKMVEQHNLKHLLKLNQPVLKCSALHNNSKAKRQKPQNMYALKRHLYLGIGCSVMLRNNLCTECGLCNGSIGIIRDFILCSLGTF